VTKSKRKRTPKAVLKLPDLEQSKSAVLNSLTSPSSRRSYDHAIKNSSSGTVQSPGLLSIRLWSRGYRISLEQRDYATLAILLGCGLRSSRRLRAVECRRSSRWRPRISTFRSPRIRVPIHVPKRSKSTEFSVNEHGQNNSQVLERIGGASRARTDGLVVANDALSQLSYSPTSGRMIGLPIYFTSVSFPGTPIPPILSPEVICTCADPFQLPAAPQLPDLKPTAQKP
jgi:hypothetical protein